MSGETDKEKQANKKALVDALHKIVHDAMANHNKIFMLTFSNIMMDVFTSFPVDQMGPAYFNLPSGGNGSVPPRAETAQTSNGGGEKSNGKSNNAINGGSTGIMVQQPIEAPSFGTVPQPPPSAGKITPSVNRLTNNIN